MDLRALVCVCRVECCGTARLASDLSHAIGVSLMFLLEVPGMGLKHPHPASLLNPMGRSCCKEQRVSPFTDGKLLFYQ